jgi:hypothetical protein
MRNKQDITDYKKLRIARSCEERSKAIRKVQFPSLKKQKLLLFIKK